MTREQLIELRWLLKTWSETETSGMQSDMAVSIVKNIDEQIKDKEEN